MSEKRECDLLILYDSYHFGRLFSTLQMHIFFFFLLLLLFFFLLMFCFALFFVCVLLRIVMMEIPTSITKASVE